MYVYLLVGLTTLLASLVLTPVSARIAHRFGWTDRPGLRKIHSKPVAYLGGAALFSSLLVGGAFLLLLARNPVASFRALDPRMFALIGGAALMLAVGLYDDIRRLSPRYKLAAQFLAALGVFAGGIRIDELYLTENLVVSFGDFSVVVTVLWIMGVTNAINFIDGLDGLAAGIATVACASIGWFAFQAGQYPVAIMMVALLGSLLGFLPYNFYPARIFLGDSGSLFLGFLLASTAVFSAVKSATIFGLGIPMIALGIPIFDTLFSMLRRLIEKRSVFSADRNHIHHRLLALGYNQPRIVLILCGETIVAVVLSALLMNYGNPIRLLGFAAILCMHMLVFRAVGAVRFKESFAAFTRMASKVGSSNGEQMMLDELELRFREAQDVREWWHAITQTASKLMVTQLDLELEKRTGGQLQLSWRNPAEDDGVDRSQPMMLMALPVRHRRSGEQPTLSILLTENRSLESACHRVSLLGKLLDRYSLAELPPASPRVDRHHKTFPAELLTGSQRPRRAPMPN